MSAQHHIDLLGKTGRDRVTGLQGVISSISFDLYGCVQAVITPPVDKEGKIVDGRWFDVHRLEIVDDKRVMPVPVFEAAPPRFGMTPSTHCAGAAEKPAMVHP